MLNQYHAQRRRGGFNPRGIGTIPVGTIVYLQDNVRPMGFPPSWACRRANPWQVTDWIPRETHRQIAGRWFNLRMAGGHLAQVKSLRDGRVQLVADWLILQCLDMGFEKFSA